MLLDSHSDEDKCCKTHTVMETNVTRLTLWWRKMLQDSHGDGD